jgi:hypothetical protein
MAGVGELSVPGGAINSPLVSSARRDHQVITSRGHIQNGGNQL